MTEREDSYIAGTQIGGQRASKTNKERYGADFYKRIGAIGGGASSLGGFASNRELARIAGRKGGTASRRGKAIKKVDNNATR